MSEWTSISVRQSQKDQLQEAKPEHMAMGEYLVGLIDESAGAHRSPINEDVLAESVVDLMAAEGYDPVALSKRITNDVHDASYRGAKQALEDRL